ncbi:Uncharacterised protein [Bordetella ansorpii]|uniref:Uncharacterized protein n=1 Tax=Bordetella ansorpii TaxID=288768 RepID=A0A157RLQ4_9BORD|nr:hypothetical protein [Bordetella ansorpii]SAI58931.1 Uncharacterised protein [Bordetella ansorpii]
MDWDNGIFDEAADQAGMRQRIDIVDSSPPAHFMADFQCPDEIDEIGGLQIHGARYEIEFTTADVRGLVLMGTKLAILAGANTGQYRVRQVPTAVGDGYWTRAQLEKLA